VGADAARGVASRAAPVLSFAAEATFARLQQPQRTGGTDGVTQFSGANGKVLAAAHGEAATIHVETTDAACAFFVGGTAPCIVFQTSRDYGATWSRHRVPSPIAGQQVLVAADPSHSGRGKFAVAVLDDTYNQWFGPTLRLRSRLFPPYSIWAAISFDDGQKFSEPLQVSQGSPAALSPPSAFSGGNIFQDLSAIALDDQRVYVGWGDWRTGERNIFFSAARYEAFIKGRDN